MPKLSLGTVRPAFKGAYDGGVTYSYMNFVSLDGETWICLVDGTVGVAPGTDETKWIRFGAKGSDGANAPKSYYSTSGPPLTQREKYGILVGVSDPILTILKNGMDKMRAYTGWEKYRIPAYVWQWISQAERDRILNFVHTALYITRSGDLDESMDKEAVFASTYASFLLGAYLGGRDTWPADTGPTLEAIFNDWGIPDTPEARGNLVPDIPAKEVCGGPLIKFPMHSDISKIGYFYYCADPTTRFACITVRVGYNTANDLEFEEDLDTPSGNYFKDFSVNNGEAQIFTSEGFAAPAGWTDEDLTDPLECGATEALWLDLGLGMAYRYSLGEWTSVGRINVVAATDGASIRTSTADPSVATPGNEGDYVLNTSNFTLWRMESGTWTDKGRFGGTATLYVTAVPADTLGLDGDTAIDTATGNIYQKASGTWALKVSLQKQA